MHLIIDNYQAINLLALLEATREDQVTCMATGDWHAELRQRFHHYLDNTELAPNVPVEQMVNDVLTRVRARIS